MRIYLVGFMGVGKSTYGKKLATRLGYEFLDTDSIVEEQEGSDIGQLFEQKGEAYFREAEKKALHSTSSHDNVVVATGGGLPAHEDNMDWIMEHGMAVYLKMVEDKLFKRLSLAKKDRPLLKDMDKGELKQFIIDTLGQRSHQYIRAAITVEPEGFNPGALAKYLQENKLLES